MDDTETHYPTPHQRRLRRTVRSADGTTGYEETVLQVLWHPMIAGQGRESEWRAVPIVQENEHG